MKNLIILLSICIISCTSVHDIQEEPRISISFASTLSNVQDTLFDVKYHYCPVKNGNWSLK